MSKASPKSRVSPRSRVFETLDPGDSTTLWNSSSDQSLVSLPWHFIAFCPSLASDFCLLSSSLYLHLSLSFSILAALSSRSAVS